MAKIIENTIRDGSYVVDFQFSLEESNKIVAGLDSLGFDFIEVGHGLGLGTHRNPSIGQAKESDSAYLSGARAVAVKAKLGVFYIPGIGNFDDIRNAHELGADFIRIGANVNQYSEMLEAASLAKELGLWVGLNLMKSYAVKPYEFTKIVRALDSWSIGDAIYLVDSAGCMTPEEVTLYIDSTREHITTAIGFHGHNNLSLAIANSCAAVRAGAEFVDSSILGLGRSAGNAQTEILTHLLVQEGLITDKFNQFALYDFAEEVIKPFTVTMPGLNGESINIGASKFHTSFLPLINEIADKYDLDSRLLIKEVSDVDCLNPSKSLVDQVGGGLLV